MASEYQAVALQPGPRSTDHVAVLRQTLDRRLKDLGLRPDTIELLDEHSFARWDPRRPTAGVYFGGPMQSAAATDAVERLCGDGLFVLPVVPSLGTYSAHVPGALAGINGTELQPGDPNLEHVAARVMEALGLMRDARIVFISYRRDESSAAALHLYQALDAASFSAFLDTHSIKRGDDFQPMLWDRLGDTDLLILIDTPNALSSRWVEQELARAGDLGLGVLQLVWPGHSRTLGTELCESFHLTSNDFVDGDTSRQGVLTGSALDRIVTLAEATRARSLAARRTRVVTEFSRELAAANVKASVQPDGRADVAHPTRGDVHVYALVGHPDAILLHRITEDCAVTKCPADVVFDPLGIWKRKGDHLRWLNEYLPTRAIGVDEIRKWLK